MTIDSIYELIFWLSSSPIGFSPPIWEWELGAGKSPDKISAKDEANRERTHEESSDTGNKVSALFNPQSRRPEIEHNMSMWGRRAT